MSDATRARLTERQRAIYDYYSSGGQRGDLYTHSKHGRAGIMRPERGYGNAMAAWLAGRGTPTTEQRPEGKE
jgi:hypothetical protein